MEALKANMDSFAHNKKCTSAVHPLKMSVTCLLHGENINCTRKLGHGSTSSLVAPNLPIFQPSCIQQQHRHLLLKIGIRSVGSTKPDTHIESYYDKQCNTRFKVQVHSLRVDGALFQISSKATSGLELHFNFGIEVLKSVLDYSQSFGALFPRKYFYQNQRSEHLSLGPLTQLNLVKLQLEVF